VETTIAVPREEGGPDGLQRIVVLIGIGYAALVTLAFYADYKIQQRRARKRREAKEAAERLTPEEEAWLENGEHEDGPER
jgi:hypothetical protein